MPDKSIQIEPRPVSDFGSSRGHVRDDEDRDGVSVVVLLELLRRLSDLTWTTRAFDLNKPLTIVSIARDEVDLPIVTAMIRFKMHDGVIK